MGQLEVISIGFRNAPENHYDMRGNLGGTANVTPSGTSFWNDLKEPLCNNGFESSPSEIGGKSVYVYTGKQYITKLFKMADAIVD